VWPRQTAAPASTQRFHQGPGSTGCSVCRFGGICWAFYIVAGQKAGASLPQGRAIALAMAVSTLVVAPFGLLQAGPALFDRSILPIALLSGLFSTAIPYSLDLFAMSHIPRASFRIADEPGAGVGALVGFVMLDERLTPLQWTAILCIVTATGGSSLSEGVARFATNRPRRGSLIYLRVPPPSSLGRSPISATVLKAKTPQQHEQQPRRRTWSAESPCADY